eukprot:scaffold17017_cov67-Phaeocystis_antarctica.AAC.3
MARTATLRTTTHTATLSGLSRSASLSSAGSTDPSEPSVAQSAEARLLRCHLTDVASRSSLQLRIPTVRHNAAAAS